MIKTVTGDLVEMSDEFDVIIQGCNCFCRMGSGLAKQIRARWPGVYTVDVLNTVPGDRNKLGTCSYWADDKLIVVNAYTQYNYGYDGKKYVSYSAIRSCMKEIKDKLSGSKFGLPEKIGAGLAGGDWSTILKIIEQELDGEDVTIVRWNKE